MIDTSIYFIDKWENEGLEISLWSHIDIDEIQTQSDFRT